MPFPPEDLLVVTAEVLKNYSKRIPTVEERQAQFEEHRNALKRQLNCSNEELEECRRNLLQEAGYDVD